MNFEHENQNIRGAERAHDFHNKFVVELFNSVISFSNAAMRAPALASAGGIAAALGFYSANYARLGGSSEALAAFNSVLFWMFLSLLATICAPGLAYFAQSFFAWGRHADALTWEHPYVERTSRSKRMERTGYVFQTLTILCVIVSIAFMLVGGLRFLTLINSIPVSFGPTS